MDGDGLIPYIGQGDSRAMTTNWGIGEEVVELIIREIDVHGGLVLHSDGANKYIKAEEELQINTKGLRIRRIEIPEGADQGSTVDRLLVHRRVEVV